MSGGSRLRRASRLRKSRDFQRVSRRGRRSASLCFVVLEAPTLEVEDAPRLGITASRKVGNAVVRNRVKRAIREWFRRHRDELGADRDYVVIARKAAATRSSREIERELCRELGLAAPAEGAS